MSYFNDVAFVSLDVVIADRRARLRVIASGLEFPEGPIAMPDGSLLVVEIAREPLSRVLPGGRPGCGECTRGPNGAALGPDGGEPRVAAKA
jgi:hypothetical protein